MSRTWGTHMQCTTHDSLVVELQNHRVLWMVGFAEFWPQNSVVRFQRESKAARGVIARVH
jgi:hypothetical protein